MLQIFESPSITPFLKFTWLKKNYPKSHLASTAIIVVLPSIVVSVAIMPFQSLTIIVVHLNVYETTTS